MLKKGKGYKSRLAGQARIVRANFVSALPVICFFLFLFYTVILIFCHLVLCSSGQAVLTRWGISPVL